MRCAAHVARMGERGDADRVLVGKPEGKRPLGIPSGRWEDNIKMNLQEVGWGAWTGLVWLRIGTGCGTPVNAVVNLWVPLYVGNFLTS